jgi:UDP-4-amino-4,6-dideoxy-N-acetyl-beta-L-altrosamine N-acetyltransferase
MIVEQYGIRLKRISYQDIELIRYWRNHPDIRNRMAFKKHISAKMQEEWFKSIDNKYNYYFLIEHKGKNIGVINSKNINLKEMYGEGGIFIWEKDIEDEFVAVLASLCFLNAVFYVLKIFNKSFIQVLKDNPRAIKFNRSLGYVLLPNQEKVMNQYYVLTKEDYTLKTFDLQKTASKITKDFEPPRLIGESSENNLIEINEILESNKR